MAAAVLCLGSRYLTTARGNKRRPGVDEPQQASASPRWLTNFMNYELRGSSISPTIPTPPSTVSHGCTRNEPAPSDWTGSDHAGWVVRPRDPGLRTQWHKGGSKNQRQKSRIRKQTKKLRRGREGGNLRGENDRWSKSWRPRRATSADKTDKHGKNTDLLSAAHHRVRLPCPWPAIRPGGHDGRATALPRSHGSQASTLGPWPILRNISAGFCSLLPPCPLRRATASNSHERRGQGRTLPVNFVHAGARGLLPFHPISNSMKCR